MRNMLRLFTLLIAMALLLAACPAPVAPANSAGKDLLTDITTRGVLRISTDPAYPPQSELVEGAQKPANSKCTGEEHTAGEFKGCTGGEGEYAKETPVLQQGLGRGQAPPGSVITVDTATKLEVAVAVEAELDDGYTFTGEEGSVDLTEEVEEAIREYIDTLPPGGEDPPGEEKPPGSGFILLNRLIQAVLNIDGVYNVNKVEIDAAAANKAVEPLQVPTVKEVELTE